jgi:SEC-C motif domain protein
MRSRYTAFTCLDASYLLATWHASTRPARLDLDAEPMPQWLGLNIIDCNDGQADSLSGTVEFVARYKINGRAQQLRETSRFTRENGRWYYLDGELD